MGGEEVRGVGRLRRQWGRGEVRQKYICPTGNALGLCFF